MAQEINGYVMSKDGDGIAFAAIYLKEKNIGIVADLEGQYRLPISILSETTDTLVFSSIGYESLRIPVPEFNEKVSTGNTNISLRADYVLLSEVEVVPNTHKPKDYGFFHLRSGVGTLAAKPSQRFMVFIENPDGVNKIIQTVNIRVSSGKNSGVEKLRIFFYAKTENGFQNISVADEDIFIFDFSQSRIRHDVSKHHILFPEEGIYVGFEIIGEENIMQDRSKNLGLNFSAITRIKKPYLYILDENENWAKMQDELAVEIDKVPRAFRNMVLNANVQAGITAY